MAEPILRLAELAGVRASYRDAFRVERRVAEENLRAVLAAMGFASESDAAIAREIAALEAERWRALLPPAVVVRDSAAPRVGFVLPERLNAGRIVWSLAGEGMRAEGSADPNALDTIETTGKRAHRHRRLDLKLPQLAPGYYSLSAAAGHENAETCLIVAPACAYLPPALADGRRAWGVAAQLYSLRSARNWGMGDFGDLGALWQRWRRAWVPPRSASIRCTRSTRPSRATSAPIRRRRGSSSIRSISTSSSVPISPQHTRRKPASARRNSPPSARARAGDPSTTRPSPR